MKYEYKVIPAPKKASKVKGLKRGEDKFAASLAALMNELGAEGWEYQRTDTLPVESRAGLTSHSTTFQNMLIFRRNLAQPDARPTAEPKAVRTPDPAPVKPGDSVEKQPLAANSSTNPAMPASPEPQLEIASE